MITLDKNNLHHAYLIKTDTGFLDEFLNYLETIDIHTKGNPNFNLIQTDNFSIDDARDVKAFQGELASTGSEKIIVIVANYISHYAQHALLKVLEDPKDGVHFFFLTPQTHILLDTLKSRFSIIENKDNKTENLEKEVSTFIKNSKEDRLAFIDKTIKKFEKEESSALLKDYSLNFLNHLEKELSLKREDRKPEDFEIIWRTKDYINDQGASVKNLLENVALSI